ncbi:LytR/AlgR family response regulator transcription factor [Pedobacter caeni]|uniref:LytTr DNA-binding domain-containing protein n=1 Tax=Pedobacter caeni TaxID=288992 RepID=A0A1M5A9T2_9SPHI|nr:LytTR family DNA-binding domain-containing protein [Pedobacter caeni]SHF27071.1 LytTr DNA-binding domain-containing protein [Pedobacter caeni]
MQLFKVHTNQQDYRSGPHLVPLLLLLISGITGFTVFQDFLHSNYNHYPFYFSESLLFKTFWLLFLPLLLLQFSFLKKVHSLVPAILLPSILHIFAFPLLVWMLSALLFTHTYSFKDVIGYTISEDAYKYLLIYGSAAFLYRYQQVTQKKQEEVPAMKLQKITVGSGRNYSSIAVEEILYISSCAPYIAIRTQQKKHLHGESLKSMMDKLDPQQFIRIHKSTIVNVNHIRSYKSRLNGDYDILLKNEEEIRLSRNYASDFKKLME